MGDRASISFEKDGYESVTFFSHWDGKGLFVRARAYVAKLKEYLKYNNKGFSTPLSRLEPDTVMVDFIREYLKDEKPHIESNYYLGKDENDGDNSDNGHEKIQL